VESTITKLFKGRRVRSMKGLFKMGRDMELAFISFRTRISTMVSGIKVLLMGKGYTYEQLLMINTKGNLANQ
jgi:hypothetical protein